MSLLTVQITEAGYEANQKNVENISFELHSGEMVGLIGSNGAGKSTTIKSILGIMEYWRGEVTFKEGIRYSFIPERPLFYDELTLWEHLDFVSAIEGLDPLEYRDDAEYLLKKFSLEEVAHQYPQTYSKGMQQKAMLVLAFIIRPQVYLIDEPFMGLDPMATKLLLEMLEAERKAGAAILMSTHVLDTAEKVCDRFIMIHKGTVKAVGTLQKLQDSCQLSNGSLFECFHKIVEETTNE